MLGAIAGDVIGSVHEFLGRRPRTSSLFCSSKTGSPTTPFFRSRLLVAWWRALQDVDTLRASAKNYPDRCYGTRFWVLW